MLFYTNFSHFFLLMSEIYQYNDPLNFNEMRLGTPKAVQGGGYYSNILLSGDPFYIQTPKIYTKNGINVTGKKIYTDLLFDRDDLDFISFINNIILYCNHNCSFLPICAIIVPLLKGE